MTTLHAPRSSGQSTSVLPPAPAIQPLAQPVVTQEVKPTSYRPERTTRPVVSLAARAVESLVLTGLMVGLLGWIIAANGVTGEAALWTWIPGLALVAWPLLASLVPATWSAMQKGSRHHRTLERSAFWSSYWCAWANQQAFIVLAMLLLGAYHLASILALPAVNLVVPTVLLFSAVWLGGMFGTSRGRIESLPDGGEG